MHPILLKLGPFTIYSYGLLVASAFLLALWLARQEAGSEGINPEKITSLALGVMIFGLIGARASYVLLNRDEFRHHPLEVFRLSHGGLVFYGGLLAGLFFVFFYMRKARLSAGKVADLLAPFVALAHALGRAGCFLAGCCYGKETTAPLAVTFPGQFSPRHPTQIYSSLALLLIFLILRKISGRKHFSGEIFLLYLLLYSLARFLIEFLRGDTEPFWGGLTLFQLASVAIFLTAGSITAIIRGVSDGKKRDNPR